MTVPLRIVQAPEPANVLWENVTVTDRQRRTRGRVANLVTFVLLLVSFLVILAANQAGKIVAESVPDLSQCHGDLPAVFAGQYNVSGPHAWWNTLALGGNTTRPCRRGEAALEYPHLGSERPPLASYTGSVLREEGRCPAGYVRRGLRCLPGDLSAEVLDKLAVADTSSMSCEELEAEILPYISRPGSNPLAVPLPRECTSNDRTARHICYRPEKGEQPPVSYEVASADGCNFMCDDGCVPTETGSLLTAIFESPETEKSCYTLPCYNQDWRDRTPYASCETYPPTLAVGCFCYGRYEQALRETKYFSTERYSRLRKLGQGAPCAEYMRNYAVSSGLKVFSGLLGLGGDW